jgi:hypothetical protein
MTMPTGVYECQVNITQYDESGGTVEIVHPLVFPVSDQRPAALAAQEAAINAAVTAYKDALETAFPAVPCNISRVYLCRVYQ